MLAKIVLVFFTFVGTACFADKRFFFEPYVGIGKLELDINFQGVGTFKEVANGFFGGAKGGVNITQKIFIGADYHSAGPFQFGQSLNNAEWTHRMIGGGLGLDYKVIRFWAGYYFTSSFDDSVNNTEYSGTAIKAGFGLPASRQLRANLELVFYDVNEQTSNGISSTVAGGLGFTSTHVSISIPLMF